MNDLLVKLLKGKNEIIKDIPVKWILEILCELKKLGYINEVNSR